MDQAPVPAPVSSHSARDLWIPHSPIQPPTVLSDISNIEPVMPTWPCLSRQPCPLCHTHLPLPEVNHNADSMESSLTLLSETKLTLGPENTILALYWQVNWSRLLFCYLPMEKSILYIQMAR